MPLHQGLTKGTKLAPLKERLAKLGLVSDWDFVLHLPLRYEDATKITPIASLKEGVTAQIEGRVAAVNVNYGRFSQLLATVEDETGEIQIRYVHFYASQLKLFEKGSKIRLFGLTRKNRYGSLEMIHPKIFKPLEKGVTELSRTLTPVYPAGESISQKLLTSRINRALHDVDLTDLVPQEYAKKLNLPSLSDSLKNLHHPAPGANLENLSQRKTPQWEKIKFDELLAQQIALHLSRLQKENLPSPVLPQKENGKLSTFLSQLPFTLTRAQKKVIAEISSDLASSKPMHRLLQGDVGAGKTIVAAFSALQAIDAGYQVALMAPTELLAEQHFRKLNPLLSRLGIRVLWLSGSLKAKDKLAAQETIAKGECDIAIGTHALIAEAVTFKSLGLAIIDEQHRFGVNQRLKLREGGKKEVPHLLMLSATPIPRTLAMSYLADIDVSVIDELPPGRTPILTKLVNRERMHDVEAVIDSTIADKHQIYWVCPLIAESEKADLAAATSRYEEFKIHHPTWRIALLHGKIEAQEKERLMQSFLKGDIDILISTTVIEVGVDVANATLMVIEQAERFGLAQLHQLRGRVGRGASKSFCILLFNSTLTDTAKERLRIIREEIDGFEIARKDLAMRGPGEFLGARQSGMPLLKFADVNEDTLLLEYARNAAVDWIRKDSAKAKQHAHRWYSSREEFLNA